MSNVLLLLTARATSISRLILAKIKAPVTLKSTHFRLESESLLTLKSIQSGKQMTRSGHTAIDDKNGGKKDSVTRTRCTDQGERTCSSTVNVYAADADGSHYPKPGCLTKRPRLSYRRPVPSRSLGSLSSGLKCYRQTCQT